MCNAGYSEADARRIMNNVMKIETSLAEKAWTREGKPQYPRDVQSPLVCRTERNVSCGKLGPFLHRNHGHRIARHCDRD